MRKLQALNASAAREHVPFLETYSDLGRLAAEQGVFAIVDMDQLLGDFWPEDERADELVEAVKKWRREGGEMRVKSGGKT